MSEIDDAYSAGSEAAFKGASETDNPYPHGTAERLSWNDGYMAVTSPDQPDDEGIVL